jgi:cell division protein FtsN
MTTIQHQRIIGVVLLFSVIIGIAMILIRSADDGAAIDNTEQISSLGFESHNTEISEPYVSEVIIDLDRAAQHSEALTLAQTVVVPETAPAPKIVQAELTATWVIQLASFSVKANADALNLQAKAMGYKSVIEYSEGLNGKIYRVRLEPIADKQKAQTIASDLNKKLKLSTQVLQE